MPSPRATCGISVGPSVSVLLSLRESSVVTGSRTLVRAGFWCQSVHDAGLVSEAGLFQLKRCHLGCLGLVGQLAGLPLAILGGVLAVRLTLEGCHPVFGLVQLEPGLLGQLV